MILLFSARAHSATTMSPALDGWIGYLCSSADRLRVRQYCTRLRRLQIRRRGYKRVLAAYFGAAAAMQRLGRLSTIAKTLGRSSCLGMPCHGRTVAAKLAFAWPMAFGSGVGAPKRREDWTGILALGYSAVGLAGSGIVAGMRTGLLLPTGGPP